MVWSSLVVQILVFKWGVKYQGCIHCCVHVQNDSFTGTLKTRTIEYILRVIFQMMDPIIWSSQELCVIESKRLFSSFETKKVVVF